MIRTLNRNIPVAAACGGMCIGILTIVADFLGAIGSGNIYNIYKYIIYIYNFFLNRYWYIISCINYIWIL